MYGKEQYCPLMTTSSSHHRRTLSPISPTTVNTMKSQLVLLSAFLASQTTLAFQPPTTNSNLTSKRSIATSQRASYYDDDEDDEDGYEIRVAESSRPETTFGAEAVPVDQRPSNEYLNLMRQPTFPWASQESGDLGLGIRLGVIYVAFFGLVCYPISGATWVDEGYELQKISASNVGAMSVLLVLLLRLYSGWGYIGSRLKSKVIEYEETGWYDGDFEEKSEAEKARDLFLYRSNVAPVEERLKKFTLIIGGVWVASCLAFNAATSSNPLFNQYDPNMLERLSYDDKVAGIVQQQSNGRPTYCESRYYRAVANGGQGCN
jgi:hypothetical protein